MKKTTFVLLLVLAFSFQVSPKRIGELPGYLLPDGLYMDGDHFYVTEGPVISIHSMKDLSLIARFGKSGEGPGEFKGRIYLDVSGPEILVNSSRRVTFYSKNGKYLREVNPVNSGRFFIPMGSKGMLLGYHSGMNKESVRISGVYLFDREFNRLKAVRTYQSIAQSEKGKGWHLFAKSYIHPYLCGSRIITAADVDFRIEIFNSGGELFKEVRLDYQRVDFTETHVQKVLERYRTNPSTAPDYEWWRKNIHFPEKFPAVRKIFTEEGRFYVRTYREEDGKHEFFVFDCNGNLIKKVFLKIHPSVSKDSYPYMRDSAPFVFRNGTIYQLVLDEETEEFVLISDEV